MSIEEEFNIAEDPEGDQCLIAGLTAREYYTHYLKKDKQIVDACISIDKFLRVRHKPDKDDIDMVREALQDALDLMEGTLYPALELGQDIHIDWGKYIGALEAWGAGWKEKALELIEKHEPETLVLYELKKEE